MDKAIAQELLDFIRKSPSCYHAIAQMKEQLEKAGFSQLQEAKSWKLEAGKGYFVTRNNSSIIAFSIPNRQYIGYQIMSSHSDSPTFKIKTKPEMEVEDHYIKLNVEKYGGMICSTWFDRPLSIAGRALVKEEGQLVTKLVNVDRDLLMLPNLAIHMNRKANDGYVYNIQKDMLPIFGDARAKGEFKNTIAKSIDVEAENIVGEDLFLYNRMSGTIWGANEEYISSPKLDDLECAFASLKGIVEAKPTSSVAVHCVFDNEEVGSGTKQGAAATFLKNVLTRIQEELQPEVSLSQALASSFMVSADNAHGVHPNYTDKMDPTNKAYLNEGIVMKFNANQKYTTDGVSAAIFSMLCQQSELPYQTFVNRSDMAGGSTLGNISNTQASLNTVDIGLAQLAMHSSYETAGVKDIEDLTRFAKTLFEASIETEADGTYRVK